MLLMLTLEPYPTSRLVMKAGDITSVAPQLFPVQAQRKATLTRLRNFFGMDRMLLL